MSTVIEPGEAPRRWQDQATTLAWQVGPSMLGGIVGLTALSTCVGWLITHPLDPIAAFDLDVARDLVAGRTAAVDDLTATATIFADSLAVAVLWVVAMAVAAWRTRGWAASVFLLVAIGGEKLTYLLTSVIVGRPRPPVQALGHVYSTTSFPSGHVGSAISLYGGVVVAVLWHRAVTSGRSSGWAVRATLGAAVVAISALVGFSRLYRGHHYLTDVAWGTVLGIVWLALAERLVLRRPRPPDPPPMAIPGTASG